MSPGNPDGLDGLLTQVRHEITNFEQAIETLSTQLKAVRLGRIVAARKVERLTTLIGEIDGLSRTSPCKMRHMPAHSRRQSQPPADVPTARNRRWPWRLAILLVLVSVGLVIALHRRWPALSVWLHAG